MSVANPPVSAYERLLAADVETWRVAHRVCVAHLRACLECGLELCPDGRVLWDAADEAEARLPWRVER